MWIAPRNSRPLKVLLRCQYSLFGCSGRNVVVNNKNLPMVWWAGFHPFCFRIGVFFLRRVLRRKMPKTKSWLMEKTEVSSFRRRSEAKIEILICISRTFNWAFLRGIQSWGISGYGRKKIGQINYKSNTRHKLQTWWNWSQRISGEDWNESQTTRKNEVQLR